MHGFSAFMRAVLERGFEAFTNLLGLRLVLWLAALNLVFQVVVLLPLEYSRRHGFEDANVYAIAAGAAYQHTPLYPRPGQEEYVSSDGRVASFLYPPPFAAAIAPLGPLTLGWRLVIWYTLVYAGLWAYAACLVRLAGRAVTLRRVLLAGLVLTVWPGTAFALTAGQADVFLWLLFALALTTGAAGIFMAAILWVKPFLAFPLAVALLRERGRHWLTAGAVLGLGILLGGVVCGWHAYSEWLTFLPSRIGTVTLDRNNLSLAVLPFRIMRMSALPDWGRPYLLVIQVAGPLLVAWLARRCVPQLQYAWVGVASLLCAPFCWGYYLPFLLMLPALYYREWAARSPS